MAIIGSGPAGFYTASKVIKHQPNAKIDMYERLPVPYGLVRYGVAPDHPEVKNVQDRFDEIALSPCFDFIGNVDVGGQIPLDVLRRHYDALLFTYGASEDRLLGIEGEKLKGVWSARNFVAWYNGLPGYSHLDFNLEDAENAVIIGQGNVSLDVARILLTSVDRLRTTDIPEHVLQALSESSVRHVAAIGRRGPLQVNILTISLKHILNVVPGSIYYQRDSRIDSNTGRGVPPHQCEILSFRSQAAATSSATNRRAATQDICKSNPIKSRATKVI